MQQTTQNQFALAPNPVRHRYKGATLAALVLGYVIGLILFIGVNVTISDTLQNQEPSGFAGVLLVIGGILLFAVAIVILVIDARGFVTLNGLIKWRSMPRWLRFVAGYFALGLWPYALPIYFVQAFSTYRHYKQQEPLLRQRKIAELEAQMGILPQTDGTCRRCKKPLQLGAEFCAHCGTPINERPRICPNCATATFPDAKWCPKCRTPLVSSSQPL
jgi:RNA polymerase subunit RPABC4/transcription elongation factor Spt4